jgi:hypothetical protein
VSAFWFLQGESDMAQQGDYSIYEWDVEEVTTLENDNHSKGDIQEHYFQTSAADCVDHCKQQPSNGCHWEICIVLDTHDSRSWAYVDMDAMTLPEWFEDAAGRNTRKVPKRFHDELSKAIKR